MKLIPFGPWRPDAARVNEPFVRTARNVFPAVKGFLPVKAPVSSSAALPSACRGAVTVRLSSSAIKSFAGTAGGLFRLSNDVTWTEVSATAELATAGGDPILTAAGDTITVPGATVTYNAAGSERWQFAKFGDLLIATDFNDPPQKIDLTTDGIAADLGGNPPKARYIGVVRDFLVLAALEGAEDKMHWSALNNAEGWTAGTNSSDTQQFPDGGPIRGFVGGEVGYVFQADAVRRMGFVPDSSFIFQFDEVEGGRGLSSPYSLVKLGASAYYVSNDGLTEFSLGGGSSKLIGVGKFSRWFADDIRSGSELETLGGVSPRNRCLVWAYVSKSRSGELPNRLLVYDWVIDEAAFIDIETEAIASWLTQGYTLDTMNSFGDLDSLPYSLDSPFWRGGAGLLGLFSTEHKLTHLEGDNLEAQIVTGDGMANGARMLIQGTRPEIDAASIAVEIAAREALGDTIMWAAAEDRETTGEVPAHVSGNYARARLTVPAGTAWTEFTGLDTLARKRGRR